MRVVMEGKIDCIMHDHAKKITPSKDSTIQNLEEWPKSADVSYSKIWIVLDGSDPENPWWLEIERPMIPQCEWERDDKTLDLMRIIFGKRQEIHSGQRVRVTMEILEGA